MTQTEAEKLEAKLTKEVIEKRNKILNDFLKAYIADRWDDYFKKKGIRISRLELVEQRDGLGNTSWSFRIKRGRPKTNK